MKKKECFTCKYKISTELTNEQRKKLKAEAIANGENFPRIPELIFHCEKTGKQISQIDNACDDYEGDETMESIRIDLSKAARKLRKEL